MRLGRRRPAAGGHDRRIRDSDGGHPAWRHRRRGRRQPYFTEYQGNRIARITTAGVITELTVFANDLSGPSHITFGPDGNLWLTVPRAELIVSATLAGVVMKLFCPEYVDAVNVLMGELDRKSVV